MKKLKINSFSRFFKFLSNVISNELTFIDSFFSPTPFHTVRTEEEFQKFLNSKHIFISHFAALFDYLL